ncbi:MAG: M48 family metallopeptidase [Desulfobacula sp.]|nr:M48 family metallopeptidase [Desulfobacula sp.]
MQLSENTIASIILITLTGSWFAGIIADLLNLKNLKKNLPKEFEGYYNNDKYLDSQNYLKTNTKFGFITSGFDIVVILTFWFSGGFNFLDKYIRSFEFGPITSGLFFIGTLLLLKLILSLPFNVYSTFFIEERFGFNKTSPILFVSDLIKYIVLSFIFGGILLSVILWFFESTGQWAWALCWIAGTLFILIIQYIVPTFIMPLFNKFTPLEEGTLKTAIFKYATSINFSLVNIFVMDGSKRSSKSNAFFAGFGKNKRIVLFDTLIKEQSIDELVAVLAHEMGHYKKKHVIKRMALSVLQMGFVFYLLSFFISNENLFEAFYVEEMSIYAGLVFFGMLYSPIDLFSSLVFQISSRKDEYEADRFAAQTLDDPNPMITALKKLSAHNLSNLTPHPFYVFLNYSHPPVMERIKALKM